MFVHIAPPAVTKMRREVFYVRRQKEAVRFCRSASLVGEKFGLTAAEFRCTITKNGGSDESFG